MFTFSFLVIQTNSKNYFKKPYFARKDCACIAPKNSCKKIFPLCSLCTKEGHFDPMCATTMLLFLQKIIVSPYNVSRPPTVQFVASNSHFWVKNRTTPLPPPKKNG